MTPEEIVLRWLTSVLSGENPPASIANFLLNVGQIILAIGSWFAILHIRAYFKRLERKEVIEHQKRLRGELRTRSTDRNGSEDNDTTIRVQHSKPDDDSGKGAE